MTWGTWKIAQLLECGLVRSSFAPPLPIRRLRNLTRCQAAVIAERTRETQRAHVILHRDGECVVRAGVLATDRFTRFTTGAAGE